MKTEWEAAALLQALIGLMSWQMRDGSKCCCPAGINEWEQTGKMPVNHSTACESARAAIAVAEGTDRVRDDAVTIETLKKLYEERGNVIASLLAAPLVDMATIAMLLGRAPDSDGLSELRGQILPVIDRLKTMVKRLETG